MNYNKNHSNLEACFAFMAECGLPFNGQLMFNDKVNRYSIDAKRNKPDEWYVAYEGVSSRNNPYLIVIFGSWSDGSKYEYKSFEKENNFSADEIIELKSILQAQRLNAELKLQIGRDNAALDAQYYWNECSKVAPSEEYLRYTQSKKIEPIGGVRFGMSPEQYPALVIPIQNINAEIRSLQYISVGDNGTCFKRFLSGGEKKGNFYIIGDITDLKEKMFIAEGYATAVSVHEATKQPVIIAFDAGNLDSVAENIRFKYPAAQIIIAADSDDVGKKKAEDAAKAWRCTVIVPQFPNECASNKKTDFNDLYQLCGIEEVAKQLNQSVINLAMPIVVPSNFFDQSEPCAEFNISYLPEALREYITALSKTTNAHPIMITSSVLATVSAFIGTKVLMKKGVYFQDLYLNLWILCIARSGQYKTTALNNGAKLANDKQDLVFKALRAMHCASPSDELKEQILKKSLEGVVLPTKLTAEAFLEHLSQGHQGAIYAGEFGGWLQNLDKNHNNDFKAILTEFYDVPSSYRSKTKTQGDYIIETPYISICGVSAMPWVRHNLKPSDISSGFFARFLLFVPPYQEGKSLAFPEPVEEVHVQAERKFKTSLENILDSIGEKRFMYPSNEARRMIQSYHDYILDFPKQYGDKAEEILQPYVKRWSPTLIKLSMLMQLFIDSNTNEVGDIAVMAAMKILIPAMKSTAMLFEKDLGESEHQRKCRIIFEFICKKIQETGKPIKRQMIMTSKRLDGGSAEYDYVLKSLIEEGKVVCKEFTKKNDSEYWVVEKVEEN